MPFGKRTFLTIGTDRGSVARIWAEAERRAGIRMDPRCLEACIHFVACQAARRSQRIRLARLAAEICERNGWRLGLLGLNWEQEFPRYAKPFVGPGEALARVFQRSKINLHLNGEVLYHNRLLEIFASGGFGLSWVPGERDDEGLHTPLTDLKRLEADLKDWLDNDRARQEEIARVGKLVRREHNYETRVKKLLAMKPVPHRAAAAVSASLSALNVEAPIAPYATTVAPAAEVPASTSVGGGPWRLGGPEFVHGPGVKLQIKLVQLDNPRP